MRGKWIQEWRVTETRGDGHRKRQAKIERKGKDIIHNQKSD